MHIATLGDVMLDVLVETAGRLVPDDDAAASITLAAGGQAANVAAWAVALGATATVIGPGGDSDVARLVAHRLAASGVRHVAIDSGEVGLVVSIVAAGTRTMASDSRSQDWLADVHTDHVPSDADWLHISGYPLLRAAEPRALQALAAAARQNGADVSADLASADLISAYGAEAFAIAVRDLRPSVVFATRGEWQKVEPYWDSDESTVVVKDGRAGASVIADGVETRYAAHSLEARDVTGAGDALAAGFLVGGIERAMEAAARCVQARGAQPG